MRVNQGSSPPVSPNRSEGRRESRSESQPQRQEARPSERPQNDDAGFSVRDGLDSRTQFEATQGLSRSKNKEAGGGCGGSSASQRAEKGGGGCGGSSASQRAEESGGGGCGGGSASQRAEESGGGGGGCGGSSAEQRAEESGGGCGGSSAAKRTGGRGGAGGTGNAGATGPTGGPAGPISEEEISKAAGGDPEIIATLMKIAQDPEGAKALRDALDKGTTFKRGQLDGNVVGLTEYGSGRPPVITLEDPSSVDTAAHEIAHAAYQGMPHDEVYDFGHRIANNLGEPAV